MDLIQTYLLEYLLLLGQKSLQSSQMQCTYKMYLSVQALKSSSKLNDQKPCGCGFKISPPPTILNIFFTIILDFFLESLFLFSLEYRVIITPGSSSPLELAAGFP